MRRSRSSANNAKGSVKGIGIVTENVTGIGGNLAGTSQVWVQAGPLAGERVRKDAE